MPFVPKFTITTKINKELVEIERVRGFLDALKLDSDWLVSAYQQTSRCQA